MTLIQRLLCFNSKYAVKYPFNMGKCILSQRHFLDYPSPTCIATLNDPLKMFFDAVFHPTAPLLATCPNSSDGTVRLWRLSSDNSSATCVATLEEHSDWDLSVTFHTTTQLLATGSWEGTVRLWLLSSDNSSATCVATLEGHREIVWSMAFHPTLPLLTTASDDKTVRVWLLSSDNSSATCIATLEEHSDAVWSVVFHPTAPYMIIGGSTVTLLRMSSDYSYTTCVTILNGLVGSVAFHSRVFCLAISESSGIVKLYS